MPALASLALRYLVWFIGLRILYTVVSRLAGLPDLTATVVILAALPAVDIGYRAARQATRDLALSYWAMIWGVIFAVFLALFVVIPALLLAPFRDALSSSAGGSLIIMLSGATGIMMAIFLLIGQRIGAAR